MFDRKTINDVDLKDKRILLRADFNVPIEDGEIIDDYRIQESLGTIDALRQQRCKIVITAHLGRPKGKVVESLSLKPVAERLGELLKQDVKFAPSCVGDETKKMVDDLKPGDILLLENVRFHPEELANDKEYISTLASYADVFVQNAFGSVHRSQASVDGVAKLLPGVAGYLVEREVKALNKAVQHPAKPLVSIIGGAKIKDKIDLIENIKAKSDRIVISGAMANTFLAAKGLEVGKSLYDESEVKEAQKIIDDCNKAGIQIILPLLDVAVADSVESEDRREIPSEDVSKDDMILDFGEKSTAAVKENLKDAGTVIWNGPFGYIESEQFDHATKEIAQFLADHTTAYTVVGGGDTSGFIHHLGMVHSFSHVSTGGGASLELMAGKKLPGIESLDKKEE